MKKFFLTLLCMMAFSQFLAAQDTTSKNNSINSNGTASIEAKPDTAYITFFVKSEGKSVGESVRQLDDSTELIIDVLKQTGKNKIREVSKFLVKLGDKDSFENGTVKTTPAAVNRITLTIEPSLELATELLDVAINNGASLKMMNGVYVVDHNLNSTVIFGIEKAESIERELTEKAIANAKINAQKTAALIGKKVGALQMVSSRYDTVWHNGVPQRKPAAKYLDSDSGKIPVEVSVSATFQLID